MSIDLDLLREKVAAHGVVTRAVIVDVKGSSPREVGAAMLVWDEGQKRVQSGTIGGGALEYELADQAHRQTQRACVIRRALGPDLGQCCGGHVTLVSERFDAAMMKALSGPITSPVVARNINGSDQMPFVVKRLLSAARARGETVQTALMDGWLIEPVYQRKQPLWIWGAGHVGRALVDVLAPLPDLDISWVDTTQARFPAAIPDHVTQIIAEKPTVLVPHAPQNASHLVLTYSHALDLALLSALLAHGFYQAGVIGSASKWARFRTRLLALGHPAETIARITCPIGDPRLGKHPQQIAIGVAAELLKTSAKAQPATAEDTGDRRA
ncbi:xanthine dehydrogenase accessory protein XdhC [Epibacterium sp. SM1969]|uniref:Xanthine dehydrogenase accessory protein XdhC n=1 Tax=Tritonibacter aquimaris TaxID=2663379 RepID=A0A844API1_9RHOB|nr:xanthine dehydrogenase accessory protein XdhC [Tritonibacter aquimaris]MQY42623.1 xanthine dehydrogenase accessory protein XdhC [Tritonibacter aquimaris]